MTSPLNPSITSDPLETLDSDISDSLETAGSADISDSLERADLGELSASPKNSSSETTPGFTRLSNISSPYWLESSSSS